MFKSALKKSIFSIRSCLLTSTKTPIYGGQAVIGGVMMKGKDYYAISLYNNTEINTKLFPFKSITSKYKILGLPFIRGIVNLFEMLILGYKSLSYSTEFSYTSDQEKENKREKKREEKQIKNIKTTETKKTTEEETHDYFGIAMIISLFFSFIFALVLFKILPLATAKLIDNYYPLSSIWFNVIDGIVKLFIFVTYIFLIGKFSDIKDVFKYHGAEHKAINCFEQKKPLTIKNVSSCSTRHLRCGTTFILLVLFISILTYIFIPKTLPFTYNLLLRLLLLFPIASISYELQRFFATRNTPILKYILYPGLLLQALTTNEPSVKHIRCAIASLNTLIEKENKTK